MILPSERSAFPPGSPCPKKVEGSRVCAGSNPPTKRYLLNKQHGLTTEQYDGHESDLPKKINKKTLSQQRTEPERKKT